MDIYGLIQQDVEAKKENDIIRHGIPLSVDARRDGIYECYEKALDLLVVLRTEIARKEGCQRTATLPKSQRVAT